MKVHSACINNLFINTLNQDNNPEQSRLSFNHKNLLAIILPQSQSISLSKSVRYRQSDSRTKKCQI